MMLKDIQVTGKKDTRSGFGDGITELGRTNPNVVALTADLAGSLKLNTFIKENPDRFIQCGIAEANMIGVAADSPSVEKFHSPPLLPISPPAGCMTRSASLWPIRKRM